MENKTAQDQIESLVKANPVFLFMKGTPQFPMCGFSARVIELLKMHEAQYESFNVLEDESVRQGVKDYGNWPTIPQLYIKGELVGGCDILMEMHEAGELKSALAV